MKISVIIPTHNRREMLSRCLASLLAQTHRPDEIIIVDDASTDETAQWLTEIHDPLVRVVRLDRNSGVAIARNLGAERASGDWLIFIDDDCVADKNFIAAYVSEIFEKFSENSVDYAWGRTDYVKAGYRGYFPERCVNNQRGRWPGSGNLAVRREAFIGVGGFDPHFLYYNNEDSEFAIRLVSRSYRYARVPAAMVYHQAMEWTAASLLRTIPNPSVWPVLKKKYPSHWREFNPDVWGGVVVWPLELLAFFTWPILVPLLFLRYVLNGQRRCGIFFVKWPLLIMAQRLLIWREAMRQGVWMI